MKSTKTRIKSKIFQYLVRNYYFKIIEYRLKKLNLFIKYIQFLSGFFINLFSKFWLLNKKKKDEARFIMDMRYHLDNFLEIPKNDQQSE